MDGAVTISADERRAAWRDELRATMALAWPLILANLTWVFSILLLGLITASSPMMATALGQRFNAVRDVRRTFRAGLWLIAIVMPPYWLLLWHAGDLMLAFGQSPELAALGQRFMRAYMWLV